uniref:Fucolectin tachylectin-4 pentraxin-1 domain-containing protein n=1 Tax=Latimeria chalumnae TaxID=7897 RepID=H3A9M8_LATCH
SCSHTRAEDDPWWRLDLLKPRTIISVVLTNRQDCCSRRLRGVHVRVGKSLRKKSNTNFECVHEHLVTSPGATVRFCCYGMTGRYVIVFIPNRRGFLSLCEVEVFGVLPSCAILNIALMGTATQSSLHDVNGAAAHAIDGNKNPNYEGLSCTHTQADFGPWWRLDLQEQHTIITVVITNREDYCSERLRGVQVWVGDSLEKGGHDKFQINVLERLTVRFCCYGTVGRYVTVLIPNRIEFLTLCEVEVFGSVPCKMLPGEKNVAQTSEVMQSSLYHVDGIPEHAIDGNRDSLYSSLSCLYTQKEREPWFRVDLLQVHKVSAVTVTNRGDCCWDHLKGAEIHIGNSLKMNGLKNPMCGKIYITAPGYTESFCCNGMEGRFVTINIPGRQEFLTLCEVELLGVPV